MQILLFLPLSLVGAGAPLSVNGGSGGDNSYKDEAFVSIGFLPISAWAVLH